MLQLKFNGILIITGHGSQSQSSNLFNFVSVFLTENNQTTSFSNNLQMFKSMLNLYILANLDQPQVFRVLLWIEPKKWRVTYNFAFSVYTHLLHLLVYSGTILVYFGTILVYSGTIFVYSGTILAYSGTILIYYGTFLFTPELF